MNEVKSLKILRLWGIDHIISYEVFEARGRREVVHIITTSKFVISVA